MQIVRDHARESDTLRWHDGSVVDPESGKIYGSRSDLVDGGQRLRLRGYVGIPALGRAQE